MLAPPPLVIVLNIMTTERGGEDPVRPSGAEGERIYGAESLREAWRV